MINFLSYTGMDGKNNVLNNLQASKEPQMYIAKACINRQYILIGSFIFIVLEAVYVINFAVTFWEIYHDMVINRLIRYEILQVCLCGLTFLIQIVESALILLILFQPLFVAPKTIFYIWILKLTPLIIRKMVDSSDDFTISVAISALIILVQIYTKIAHFIFLYANRSAKKATSTISDIQ